MKMRKSAYGLSDAPLLWWTEADRQLRQLKLVRRKLDKCTYMMYNSNGQLIGLMILHVDDVLLGADMNDPETVTMINKIKSSFDFGKWQTLDEKSPMIYCGGRISKQKDGISLDFEEYVHEEIAPHHDPQRKRTR